MLIRRTVLIVLALGLAAGVTIAAQPKAPPPAPAKSLLEGIEIYNVDAPHSEISFVVPWMGISKVRGSFQNFLGTITFDTLDLTRSSVTIIISASSINTGFEMRDKDLKGQDFFAVDKYPSITFSSREVARTLAGFVLRGPLTIHGVTKEIEIPFVFNGHIKDASGDDRIGFEGHLTLKRKEFGIVGPPRFNLLLEKGIIIGEDVDIPLAVEGWKAAPRDTMRDLPSDSLYRAVLERGLEVVAQQYRELRAKTADSLMAVNESTLNDVGYQFLSNRRINDAIGIFKLEIESYSKNAFGYVGLGNSYAVAGNRELAVQMLEKAVAINPQAPRALEILKRLKG